MKAAYRFALFYFCLFGILLLLGGCWLFGLKIGFTTEAVEAYYLGSPELFTRPKSVHGLLEVALPHLGAMGLFIMTSAHFLIFAPSAKRTHALWLSTALFIAALSGIFAPFAIAFGWTGFVWVKLAAFFILQLLGLYLLWILFSETFRTMLHHRDFV